MSGMSRIIGNRPWKSPAPSNESAPRSSGRSDAAEHANVAEPGNTTDQGCDGQGSAEVVRLESLDSIGPG